ncbi:hypothetical protein ACIQWA_06810 [Kitasatospora sp. NPDC098652]|uniref:hypothetical protein n=1 Tax=Kitasatospora sp. NPDC098652 TaxID=3364095 RepID=UPI0038010AD5
MPPLVVGRRRAPLIALVLGLVLLAMAHLTACAAHEHGTPHATTATVLERHAVAECAGSDRAHGQHSADHLCCDAADGSATVPGRTGLLLLGLAVAALLLPDFRPPVRAIGAGPFMPLSRGGTSLLRLACVSRT